MVSESVLCPVNMMIGALKPFLRRMRTASRPSMSGFPTSTGGKPDIHDHEIDLTGLGGLYALGSIVDRDRLEFLKQCELLDQRLAQLGVVVHDQDFAGIRHSS